MKLKTSINNYSLWSAFRKIRERGVFYCLKRSLEEISFRLKSYIKLFFWNLESFSALIFPPKGCIDSVLAIYDFRVSPYSFNFIEFLVRAEVYRVKHSLSHIDLVFVVDRKNVYHRDHPKVSDSNYRNWILNLAESTDLLRSIGSISIFDDTHKFLSFYHKARYAHKVYPETGAVYVPQARYHFKYVSDYYRATGFVPKFESSGVLLEWAEKYFLEKSYPLLPVVVFVRNADIQHSRNTALAGWFDFFRRAVNEYPVKFFIVNDFWNPIEIPADLAGKVVVSPEATISVRYRAALTQRATLVMSVSGGPFIYCYFMDTPYLVFGLNSDMFNAKFYVSEHGMNNDLRFPWATKYQLAFPELGDTQCLSLRFKELYDLLQKDSRLIPGYYNSKQKDFNPLQV